MGHLALNLTRATRTRRRDWRRDCGRGKGSFALTVTAPEAAHAADVPEIEPESGMRTENRFNTLIGI